MTQSLRSDGSYIGYNRVTTTAQDSASGIWSLAAAERRQRAGAWPLSDLDPYFANVSLLLHMDGANNSTAFTDSSSNARTISRSGTTAPVISTAQSKFGGAGGLFVNGQLDIPGAAAFQGTENFVLEFWLYWSSIPSSDAAFTAMEVSGGFVEFGIFNAASDIILSTPGGVHLANFGSKNQLTANQWNFVALSRSGNTFRCFVNGEITTSGPITSSASLGSPIADTSLMIGKRNNANTLSAYMDDVRITRGSDRGYTGSTITVPAAAFPNTGPAAAPTDPYFANVELLLHCDNNFTDSSSSPKTVTANNGAATSAAKSKWGGYSCSFDGSNDFLSVPDSASFQFGSGNFVIEAWVLWESVATYQMLWQKHTNTGAPGSAFFLRFDGAVSPKRLNLAYCIGSSQYEFNGTFSPNTNQWYHIALVRSGNDWSIYADGTRIATENRSGTLNTGSGQNLRIGTTASLDTMFHGYMDDFRVTKGSDRGYTANFTPPTAAFPDA